MTKPKGENEMPASFYRPIEYRREVKFPEPSYRKDIFIAVMVVFFCALVVLILF